MPRTLTASVIIPTLGRSSSLRDCLESLWAQSFQDFDIIQITEKGELAALRNKGARKARGKYLVFIDDDVICSPKWMESIIRTFQEREVGGVSGPAYISSEYRRNRDIFRFGGIKFFYDLLFLDGKQSLPGHITKAGAWTTGACEKDCSYEGPVHFLEACNMAFKADIFEHFGGFDEKYKGVGDWSEPDLAFWLRQDGHKLWFSRDAALEHMPSKSGAFKKRLSDSRNRMANYELFASRWVKPHWKHSLYKQFLKGYYGLKSIK